MIIIELGKIHYVVAGPSKWDLATAFFGKKPSNSPKVTFFVMIDGGKQPLLSTIHSVAAEDGSGECWNLTGYCYIGIEQLDAAPPPPQQFSAFFRTDKRTGTVTFLPN